MPAETEERFEKRGLAAGTTRPNKREVPSRGDSQKKSRKSTFRDARHSAWISAEPEDVYEALTSARELCAWWTAEAETDVRNLGRFHLAWAKSKDRSGQGTFLKEARGVFVDLERARKVSWLWDAAGLPKGTPALSSIFIEPKEGGCRVTVVHAGFSSSADKIFVRFSDFWKNCLDRLNRYFNPADSRLSPAATPAVAGAQGRPFRPSQ